MIEKTQGLKTQLVQTQAVGSLCPARVIAIVIIIEGKLGLKKLAQGCTYEPGNIPSRGSWLRSF